MRSNALTRLLNDNTPPLIDLLIRGCFYIHWRTRLYLYLYENKVVENKTFQDEEQRTYKAFKR